MDQTHSQAEMLGLTGDETVKKLVTQALASLKGEHLGIKCNYCAEPDLKGSRYRCATCSLQYNLCAGCFERRDANGCHSKSHPMIYIPDPLSSSKDAEIDDVIKNKLKLSLIVDADMNTNVKCHYCKTEPIKGARFQCVGLSCILSFCEDCSQNMPAQDHMLFHSTIVHINNYPIVPFDVDKDIEYLDQEESHGCFGSVRKVKYKGRIAALKTIKVDENDADQIRLLNSYKRECIAYRELFSNQIIRYFGCSQRTVNNITYCYLLTEFMDGGTLQSFIKGTRTVSLRTKFEWILNIVKGIRRMHDKGFIHKDIKPDNILLDSKGNLKIGDMGIALVNTDGKYYFYEPIAPRDYAAPEIRINKRYTKRADIFSLGLVINQLFTGKEHTRDDQTKNGKLVDVRFNLPEKSRFFSSLINQCLKKERKDRLRACEIEEKLELFDDFFWKNAKIKKQEYAQLAMEEQNKIFEDVYKKYKQPRRSKTA